MREGAPYLDRAAIATGFRLLADELGRRHQVGTVYLFGGGAMMTAFDSREATRDLDARLSGDMQEAILAVATQMGWPRSWLNEQGTVYLPPTDDPHPAAVFDHPHLRVMRVSDRHLLAMKAAAARRQSDLRDLQRLIERLGLRSAGEVVRVHDEVFPDAALGPRQREVIQEAFEVPTSNEGS
ncbi:MAG: hypothetical protein ACRENY_09095 [Candidatus Dormibacteria bacterium]